MANFSQVASFSVQGITAMPVLVEAHISSGLPKFNMVGLAESVVRESKERVRSALLNNNLPFPNQRVTINLAPAGLPKQGGDFDLPIAISLLIAQGLLSQQQTSNFSFCAELSLTGKLRPINNALAILLNNKKTTILAKDQPECSSLPLKSPCLLAIDLLAIIDFFTNNTPLIKPTYQEIKSEPSKQPFIINQPLGQQAINLAAVGGHNLRLIGPPGCGKSLLAKSLSSLLPALSETELLTCSAIKQAAQFQTSFDPKPAFIAPHHSITQAGLIGGGSPIKPGAISLAHKGVLFLDEITEISRSKLEALREPLEAKKILISRAGQQLEFPCDFQLICAMNPCPCGYATHPKITCNCPQQTINQYLSKLSGPFLDRVAIHLHINTPTNSTHQPQQNQLSCEQIKSLRKMQIQRQQCLNNQLDLNDPQLKTEITTSAEQLVEKIYHQHHLSFRRLLHTKALARSLADINGIKKITAEHIQQAFFFQNAAN